MADQGSSSANNTNAYQSESRKSTTQLMGNENYKSVYTLPANSINYELRRKLWEGLLPIKVDLGINDLSALEQPRSMYLMIPRQNYLFYILNDVKSLFDAYGPPDKLEQYSDMWFEFNGHQLHWNLPIGAQFDCFVGHDDKQKELPWSLVFHYQQQKHGSMIKNSSALKIFQYYYINALKQSQTLRAGDANQIFSQLTANQEKKMIDDGLFKNNYESFWEINQAHILKHAADLKRFAIKVGSNKLDAPVLVDRKIPEVPRQDSGELYDESTEQFQAWYQEIKNLTIGEILSEKFPRLFSMELNEETCEAAVEIQENFELITQGMKVDLNTPVYWMQLNLSYLDNFIHLSLHFK